MSTHKYLLVLWVALRFQLSAEKCLDQVEKCLFWRLLSQSNPHHHLSYTQLSRKALLDLYWKELMRCLCVQVGVEERERLLVFTIRWKKSKLHQVELRYATASATWMCLSFWELERMSSLLWVRMARKEICIRFSTPAERGGEKNEREGKGKRNSDHVLCQSISAATNGCSEKVN